MAIAIIGKGLVAEPFTESEGSANRRDNDRALSEKSSDADLLYVTPLRGKAPF